MRPKITDIISGEVLKHVVNRRGNVHGDGVRVVSGGWRPAQNGASLHARYLGPAGQTGRIWTLCGFKVPARASAVGITVACQDVSAASVGDRLQQRGR